MIFTYGDYIHALVTELGKRPKRLWVSTFNFHIGISPAGGVYENAETYRLVKLINDNTTGSRILVGMPPVGNQVLVRKLTNSAEYFNNIQFRSRADMHLKCWIFFHQNGDNRALVGGRNLGDSEWADLNLWIDRGQTRRLVKFYDDLWLKSKPASKSNLKLI